MQLSWLGFYNTPKECSAKDRGIFCAVALMRSAQIASGQSKCEAALFRDGLSRIQCGYPWAGTNSTESFFRTKFDSSQSYFFHERPMLSVIVSSTVLTNCTVTLQAFCVDWIHIQVTGEAIPHYQICGSHFLMQQQK